MFNAPPQAPRSLPVAAVMLALALLSAAAHPAARADAAAPPAATPGMRILAIERTPPPLSPDALKKILPQEMSETLRLYLDGRIEGWYQRKDHPGVVFILNAASVEEAQALLDTLPLGRQGMLSFDLIPIGPLGPLRTLLLPAAK